MGTRGFSEWQMGTGFHLKSPAARAPAGRGSLSSEASKPGTDFSLATNVLDGIFFQGKAASPASEICRLVAPPSLAALARPSGKPAAPPALPLRSRLLSNSAPVTRPPPASDASSAASSPSAFLELKRAGPRSGRGCGLRDCCGWFRLLSGPPEPSPHQQSAVSRPHQSCDHRGALFISSGNFSAFTTWLRACEAPLPACPGFPRPHGAWSLLAFESR